LTTDSAIHGYGIICHNTNLNIDKILTWFRVFNIIIENRKYLKKPYAPLLITVVMSFYV